MEGYNGTFCAVAGPIFTVRYGLLDDFVLFTLAVVAVGVSPSLFASCS